ncbi:MAG: PHB depolymerase family esterase [Anaerolineales bacterium]
MGFIAWILDTVIKEFRVDPSRIYAAGFSNGASLAFLVGIELNETIAAIAPVAGALWIEDFGLESPVSLLYITGTEDPLNPIDGGVPGLAIGDGEPGGGKAKPPVEEHIQLWTGALACESQPEILTSAEGIVKVHFSQCRDNAEVVYYTLEDVGHHWPGGKVRLSEILVGKSTDVMNATEVIWEFFQDHPKP